MVLDLIKQSWNEYEVARHEYETKIKVMEDCYAEIIKLTRVLIVNGAGKEVKEFLRQNGMPVRAIIRKAGLQN